MKKITSFLTLLLMLVTMPAFAQLDELSQKSVTLGEAAQEIELNQWYVLSNGGRSAYVYSNGLGEKLYAIATSNATIDGEMATSAAKYLVRFTQAEDGTEGHLNIQTGLGDWFGQLTTGGNNGTTEDPEYYFTYGKIGEEVDWFWFFGNDGAMAMDCNAAGGTLAGWGTSVASSTTSNAAWQLITVTLEDVDARDAALSEMGATYNQYAGYADSFVAGTDPGCYSADAIAAFQTALDNAANADGPDGESLTADDLLNLKQAIIDTYNAVIASKVPLTVADGYYRLQTGWPYTTTVTTEDSEDPETGEVIPGETKTVTVAKAMYADGTSVKWGSLDVVDAANYLWKVTKGTNEDCYQIVNAGTNGRFTQTTQSAAAVLDESLTAEESEMRITLTGNTGSAVIFAINRADQTGAYSYLHQGSHGMTTSDNVTYTGTGTGSNVVGWTSGAAASQWQLVAVSNEEADSILAAAIENEKHAALLAAVDSMYDYASAAVVASKELTTVVSTDALISDATQFSSPFTTTDDQCSTVDEVYPYLLDGDVDTYWHSAWEGGSVAAGTHYLQVDLIDGSVASTVALTITRRNCANDHVTSWAVYGSNEADLENTLGKDGCEFLANVSTPFGAKGETVTSAGFDTKGYQYLRFYIANTTGNGTTTRGYGHAAEFQLYKATVIEPETSQYKTMGEIATNMEAALAARPASDDDITEEYYNTLKTAYDAFVAAYDDPNKKIDAVHNMITTGNEALKVAIDAKYEISDEALITESTQFSSPYTTTDEQCDSEDEVYTYLLDGNTSTYWHSAWESGSVSAGTHYLQVELTDPSAVEFAAMTFTRRAVQDDHITVWSVYGTNEADADKSACELLATLNTPYSSNTETLTSDAFATKGYQYLRFYIDNTAGSNISSTRGYGHVSEFQLYKAAYVENATSQYVAMGTVATNLEAAIAACPESDDEITDEYYNTLRSAYNAFMAIYVNPADLRAAIASAKAIGVVEGTNPGCWSTAYATNYNTAITTAETYDAAGAYTPAKSEELTSTLTANTENAIASANQIETGKWYEIRFATEAEYDANKWSKSNAEADIDEEDGTEYSESLYGKYMTAANLVEGDVDEETGEAIDYIVEGVSAADVCIGNGLYFDNKESDIIDEDLAKFRFIAVGDTAYIMQNKATGLYVKATGAGDGVTLSVHPSLFKAAAAGYGQNIISAENLEGASQSNLHAQRDYNVLVTWGANKAGTNSGLYIEDINEPVASDYNVTECKINTQIGAYAAYCYPVEMTPAEGNPAQMYTASATANEVTLYPITSAAAGRPFILINGDTEEYNADATEDEYEAVSFIHGTELNVAPAQNNSLKGTYYGETIGKNVIVAEGNTLKRTTKSNTTIGTNTAWIATDENFDSSAEIVITISTEDGIQTAIANVAKSGNIYTVDGRLVGKGNLNTIKNMGRGIYVINGVKVAVK